MRKGSAAKRSLRSLSRLILAGGILLFPLFSPEGQADPVDQTLPCPPNLQGLSPSTCRPAIPPPAPSPARTLPKFLRFHHGKVYVAKITKANWRRTFRQHVAASVAKRIYPHPTMGEFAILDTTIRFLGNEEMHMKVTRTSPVLYRIRVSRRTLNRIEARLLEAVKKGHLDYRVGAIAYKGGSSAQQKFIKRSIFLPADHIMDSRSLADELYEISQIPGFKRADAIFSAAIHPRDLHFDAAHGYARGIRFVIHTASPHWSRIIRRSIVLYVANLLFDMKNPFAQEIALHVARHSEKIFWRPMIVAISSRDTYRVRVPVKLLQNIRNALLDRAQNGEPGALAPAGKSEEADAEDSGTILDSRPSARSFGDIPVTPRSQEIAPPVSGPEFENLLLHITPLPLLSGSQIEVDNYGYAPTGALVPTFSGAINNAGTPGGLLTLNASTSFGGLNSGTLSYSAPLNLTSRAGTDLIAMNYVIGRGYSPWGQGPNAAQQAALGIAGDSYGADLWSQQAITEHPDKTLFVKELIFWKAFQDTYSQTTQNLRQIPGATLDINGFLNRSPLAFSVDLSTTVYDLFQGAGSSPGTGFLTTTPGVRDYTDLSGSMKLSLSKRYALLLSTMDQQGAGGLLDPMLQATLGGMANVRALPTAALFGNNLDSGSLSFSRSDPTRLGDLSDSLFFDAGEVWGSGGSFAAMGPGLEEFLNASHFYVKMDVAVPVGPLPLASLGPSVPAMSGGNIAQGGIPLQGWLSVAIKY